MKLRKLADAVRKRKIKSGKLTQHQCDALSDLDMILPFVTCKCCDRMLITHYSLYRAINKAKNVSSYIALARKFEQEELNYDLN